MKEFRKRLWTEVALCASFFPLIHSTIAFSAAIPDQFTAAKIEHVDVDADTYTINFNNVAAIEFFRFASKITNLNFVFDEADLQFNVTVISEEAVTAKNVMSALAQVVRMHDLSLIEQDGNVLITKNKNVHAIAPIVSADIPDSKAGNSVLVTRVFRIKNASVSSIANILRPMTSSEALIEVSVETRQLIVTDITTNVEQIASLLESLDTPHTPLDVGTYIVRQIAPSDLIVFTQQILNPFTEGNPLIFVPQIDTNTIFIVSTPHLIERALTVMEDLDAPPKRKIIGKLSVVGKNFYFYNPTYLSPNELLSELKQLELKLQKEGGEQSTLRIALESVETTQDGGSLVFLADNETAPQLEKILSALDNAAKERGTFYLYKIQHAREEHISDSLRQMVGQLEQSNNPDQELIDAINSLKWIRETNTLVFTGTPKALDKIKVILPTLDISPGLTAQSSEVLIYKPQYSPPDQIQNALKALVPSLDESHTYADQNLVSAIQALQWNPDTQTFSVTSDPSTVARLKTLLSSFDNPQQLSGEAAKGFFLYKLQNAKCDAVLEQLKMIAQKLPPSTLLNQNLITAIGKIECVKSNNTLLITGPNDAIDQIKAMISEFDLPTGQAPTGQTFLIYKPKFLPGQEIQLALTDLSKDLLASGLNDPVLFDTLATMRYVPTTNTLIFTGTQDGIDRIQNLISTIDTSAALGAIQRVGNITFLLYKIHSAAPDKLMSSLKAFALTLKQSDVPDKKLSESIDNVRWIKETNSLLFTGNEETLTRVEELLKKFDTAALQGPVPVERTAPTFVIYNPKYLTGDELILILCDFMDNLSNAGVSDPGLFDTISNLKWIDKTSALLISGDDDSVAKVQDLLQKFDMPSKDSATPSIESIDNTSFLVYKLQYHPGSDIQIALKQVALNLVKTGGGPSPLADAIDSLQWIQVTNSLLCTGQQDILIKLKDLIQNIDVPLRQVFIEMLFVETTISNIQNFGLMWGAQSQYFNKATMAGGNFPTNNSSSSSDASLVNLFGPTLQGINATNTPAGGVTNRQVPFVNGFDLGVIGDIIMHKGKSFLSLGALVNALQSDNDTVVVLNPKILTQDNRQSIIFVGSNVPYTGAIVQNQQSNTTTTSNIEYRDVGMSLTITPVLGDGDIVTMDIVQDISQVTGGPSSNTSTLQLTGITTSHTHMETRVQVPNNHFVALSGMIDESKTVFRTAIPCLGGLPVVGALFSENDRSVSKDNIIIFIRPVIINTYEEYKRLTEHQEWLYKDSARKPVLKEWFDEAVDLVKVPENE